MSMKLVYQYMAILIKFSPSEFKSSSSKSRIAAAIRGL